MEAEASPSTRRFSVAPMMDGSDKANKCGFLIIVVNRAVVNQTLIGGTKGNDAFRDRPPPGWLVLGPDAGGNLRPLES